MYAWAAFTENSGLLYRIIYRHLGLEPMIDSGDRVEFDGKHLLVMTIDGNGEGIPTPPNPPETIFLIQQEE